MVKIKADEGYWYGRIIKVVKEAKKVRLKYFHFNTAGRLVESKELNDIVAWDTMTEKL